MGEIHDHLKSLLPPDKVSRRAFVVTAWPRPGSRLRFNRCPPRRSRPMQMVCSRAKFKSRCRTAEIPAYRAYPASGGSFPTVLVIQEIFGVHEWVKDICRRLAHLGYFAVAVSLNARQGDVSKATDMPG